MVPISNPYHTGWSSLKASVTGSWRAALNTPGAIIARAAEYYKYLVVRKRVNHAVEKSGPGGYLVVTPVVRPFQRMGIRLPIVPKRTTYSGYRSPVRMKVRGGNGCPICFR